jgi:FkbM family methyltransferase
MPVDWMRGWTGRLIMGGMDRLGVWRHWERWLDPSIERLLAGNQGCFVDVGVNVGQTLLKMRRLSPETPYVGFEPNLQALAQVQTLVRRRRMTGCTFYPMALGTTFGIADLRSRGGDADPAASVVEGFRGEAFYSASRAVTLAAGDEVLTEAGHRPVALIKIDVEGGEMEVLQGLQQTLAGDRPPVLCEVLPVYDPAESRGKFRLQRQEEIERLLGDLDYRILRLDRSGGLIPLTTIGVHADLKNCDYLFLPAERLADVDALCLKVS